MTSQTHNSNESKRTEESEERYRLIVEYINEGILVAQDGILVYANPNVMEIGGYSLEELSSKPFVEFIHPDDREMVIEYHIKRLKGDEVAPTYTFRTIDKDGTIRWAEASVVMIEWDGIPASLIFMKDITDRKKAEKALKESEEKYSTLVEKGNDGIVILQDGLLKFANSKMAEITGFSVEEGVGKPFIDFVAPEYKELIMERHKKRIAGKMVKNRYEAELISKDNRKIPVEINANMIDYKGRPADMAIIRDITDRKKAEKALKESEKRYRSLFEDSRDALYIITRKGKFIEANQSFLELFGYMREELFELNVSETYVNSEERIRFQQEIEQRGSVRNYEVKLRKKDGTEMNCLITSTVRCDDTGDIIGYQGIIRDITEQKLTENALKTSKELYKTLASLLLVQNKKRRDKSIDLRKGFEKIEEML
jgi:PAS domain S-box-containing protein